MRFLLAATQILASCGSIEQDIYSTRLSNELGVSVESIKAQLKTASVRQKRAEEAKKRNLPEIDIHSFASKNGSIVFFAKKAQDGRQRVTEVSCSAPEENKENVKENH